MPKRNYGFELNGKLYLSKKSRLDDPQVVPDIDCDTKRIPEPGSIVNRRMFRKAGPYIIGPSLGHSPTLDCMVQYLARKENTKEFYQLKILYINENPNSNITKLQEYERTGKIFLLTECSLLSILKDEEGIIQQHGLFWDTAMEEEYKQNCDSAKDNTTTYTGKIKRRLILVLDSVTPHKYNEKSAELVNLQQYLKEGKIKEREALQIFYEIVKVIERLHKKNIIHRDLKIANIVLNRRSKKIILTNFSLGKQLMNENESLNDKVGTPNYISPDVLSHQPYKGKPSDMWTLGVVLFIMIYGKFPFFEKTTASLFKKIKLGDYTIPNDFEISSDTIQLVKGLLTLNADDRLTATNVRITLEKMFIKRFQSIKNVDQIVPQQPDEKNDDSAEDLSTKKGETNYNNFLLNHNISSSPFSGVQSTIGGLGQNGLPTKIKLSNPRTQNNSILHSSFYNYQIRRVLIDRLSTLQLSPNSASGGLIQRSNSVEVSPSHSNLTKSITDAFNEHFLRQQQSPRNQQQSPPINENLLSFNGKINSAVARNIIAWLKIEFRANNIIRFIFLNAIDDEKKKIKQLFRILLIQMDRLYDGTMQVKRDQTPEAMIFVNFIFKGAGFCTSYFNTDS